MFLPAVQPVEPFVGDVLNGGGVVVLCSYLPVELFVRDILNGGDVVVLCSYLLCSQLNRLVCW